jgi:hypothetical protein
MKARMANADQNRKVEYKVVAQLAVVVRNWKVMSPMALRIE